MGGAPASNGLAIASPKKKLGEAIKVYCFPNCSFFIYQYNFDKKSKNLIKII
jgi:hypothetical protein